MELENETLVNVKLYTKYERFQMGTSSIAVPARFSRFELSRLVNEALELEKPIPFDFVINGTLLRVSLMEYITSHGLSLESTLDLEYVPIIGKPEEKSSDDLPDWVGGLSCNQEFYAAGCYDGSLHIYGNEDQVVSVSNAHTKPIKSVDIQKFNSATYVASTSLDNTMKLFRLENNSLQNLSTCSGHDSHVLCCKIDGSSGLVVSGAWNGSILVWNLATLSLEKEPEPVHTLSESMLGITALEWSEGRVISGGWDHTLRIWDLEAEGVTTDMKGNKVINAISVNRANRIIASAHPDGAVRLWDPRQAKSNVLTFNSQKQYMPSVQWHPTQEALLSAVDYSGNVTVFDMRSVYPIHIAEHVHQGKILCSAWKNEDVLLTGGEDKKLRRLSTRQE